MTDDLIDEMRPANDALAEAMRAAGYQRVERRLPAAHREVQRNDGVVTALKWRNAELARAVNDLKQENDRLQGRVKALDAKLDEWRAGKIEQGMSLMAIAKVTVRRTGITVADIRGRSRRQRICIVRDAFCHAAYYSGKFSQPEIGEWLGRDHSTVNASLANHAARLRRESTA